MWNKSITIDMLADDLVTMLSVDSDNSVAISAIKKEMPSISDADAMKVCQLVCSLTSTQKADSVEIVATTPVSFHTKTRKTRPVIQELINGASQSILLTGYSISDHFEDMFKLINSKSKLGISVELFVNKYESIKSILLDIEHTNRHFFKVYEYSGKADDKMASLHAKTIIVDGVKMLISSANLSYHGLDGNIEVGVLINSTVKSTQVRDVFAELKRQGVFVLVK